ncbi:shufflon system plasmid conjugative transfer pilus tip adhesin PilV [Selenomonas sp.]|uniref:shufflon system plasmid conjugative transfer pilus tip adhesin PilV n=1 Tax=Selenomonas sp. TaxID=2053611 RepID=UPI003FA2924D
MAQFPKIQLTQLGKNIILAGQNKQKVTFTKVELGDGLLDGQSVDDMTALVHSVMSLPLQNFLNNGDGSARLRFVLDNNNLAKGFFNREIGVFAKIDDGEEQLYAYTNAGNLADYIPGKESPISSKIINLHIIVGNAMNLTIVAENSAYVTKLDMDSHKAAVEIDHPDASVTTPKIRDGAVTSAKIAERAIEKKHLRKGGIVAGDIGAYSKEDVNKLFDAHRKKTPLDHPDGSVLKRHLGFEVYDKGEVYSKNEINQSYRKIGNRHVGGDIDWNTLTEPTTYKISNTVMDSAHHAPPNEYNFGLLVVNRLENGADSEWRTMQIYFPHSVPGYWSRMYNGPDDYRAGNWAEWRYIPTQNEVETIAEQKANTRVSKSGDTMTGNLGFDGSNKGIDLTHGYIYGGGLDSGDAITHQNGANINIGSWWGIGFYDMCNKRYTGSMDLRSGNWRTLGSMTAETFYTNTWFRALGDCGFYFEDHGGGWHMTDNEWIRVFNGKNIYTSGKMRCDAGFEGDLRGTASNANNLGGQSLQWILEQIKNSIVKIAILTGTVAHGGTIPLPNGFLESQCKWTVSPATIVDFATAGDLNDFGCTVDGHRKVSCVAEGHGDSVNTIANYIIIGVK